MSDPTAQPAEHALPSANAVPAVPATTSSDATVVRTGNFWSRIWQEGGWPHWLLKNGAFLVVCGVGVGLLFGSVFGSSARRPAQPPEGFTPARAERFSQDATLSALNTAFAEHWREVQLAPTPAADNLTLARRISLGLTGTIPSLEELRELERVPADQQLAWWTQHVLEDRRYADYVAERLARAFVGAEDGPFIVYRRRRFVLWLSDQLAENRRYDAIVRDLIASDGLWTTNPAVNFITVTQDSEEDRGPDPIRLAARTSRAFLAMRIDCLQCHDDKLGNTEIGTMAEPRLGLQTDFHSFAAFFGDVSSSAIGVWDPQDAPAYAVELLGETEPTELQPMVPYGSELLPSGGADSVTSAVAKDNAAKQTSVEAVNHSLDDQPAADSPTTDLPNAKKRGGRRGRGMSKREQLAAWVTHAENKQFARATVNRVWALLFGKPLVEPIDDIPLFGERPPGMDLLADDFIAHNYDLRRLMRLIVSSEPFRRDSRADFVITPRHEREWAAFPVTRLRPEQVAGALIQASSLSTIDADAHVLTRLIRHFQEREFVERYGDPGDDEFTQRAGTIPQRLLTMNGNLLAERITGNSPLFNAISQISALSGSDVAAVEAAYLCVLTRRPSEAETTAIVAEYLDGKRGPARGRAVEDVVWILMNSSGFSWNH